jgi:CRP-like cAMP-binding protein
MARISAVGHRRPITAGEVLVEVGDKDIPFFVVVRGAIQILRPAGAMSTLIVKHRSGEFVGETNMIAGRPAIIRALVTEPGEVLVLEHRQLLAIVQTDAELSDILMRAFIRARRSGRVELQDRELSWLSDRHFGAGAHVAGLFASPEVRRANHDCERGDGTELRPTHVRGADRRRPARARAGGDYRVRRGIPKAAS